MNNNPGDRLQMHAVVLSLLLKNASTSPASQSIQNEDGTMNPSSSLIDLGSVTETEYLWLILR